MNRRVKLSKYVIWWTINGETYAYSSLSGALIRIDRETEQLLKMIQYDDEITDEEQRKYLIEKAILVPEKIDEFGTFRFFSFAEQFNIVPTKTAYTIAVTESCNYHCKYCFESKNMKGREMTPETETAIVSHIIQNIEASNRLQELRITWFGGEPLLKTKTIESISIPIISCCEKKGIDYSASIITNGSLVNEKTLQLFQKIKVSFVQITLDGDSYESCNYKGCTLKAFEDSISAILEIAKTTKIHVRLNTDGKNTESIIKIVKRIHSIAMNMEIADNIRFYLACIDAPGQNMMPQWFVNSHKDFLEFLASENMKEDILFALPKARYSSCGATTNSHSFINPDGTIVKCEHFLGRDEKSIGNVFDGLYHNSNEEEFRDICIQEECIDCSFYPICRQGCLAKRLEEQSTMNCQLFKENVRNIITNYLKCR